MLPKELVLDEVRSPENFDALQDLLDTQYRVEHELTTLEAVSIRPDGTVRTPAGEWRATRDFLEASAKAIGMPLGYAYKVSAELFCENFAQRRSEATSPITISRVGEVATGLILDRRWRYRPARMGDVLRAIGPGHGLEFRRASVSFAGVDVELTRSGAMVEPALGDVVEVGIALTNSESGGRHLKASAYSYRLVCTNGAIMADVLGAARWSNDPRMTEQACLRALLSEVGRLCDRLEEVSTLYRTVVDRRIPLGEFGNLWRRVAYVVPREEADAVLGISGTQREELHQRIRGGDSEEVAAATPWNVYETHNRITYAAHGQSFGIRRALQEVGGELLSRALRWTPVASAN